MILENGKPLLGISSECIDSFKGGGWGDGVNGVEKLQVSKRRGYFSETKDRGSK